MRRSEFTVTADHHQFLVYSGNSPVITAASAGDTGDGLVAVSDGGLRIVTGTNYGPLAVRVELHNNEPPPPTAEWTEVSEVSFRVRVGPVEVGTLMGGPLPVRTVSVLRERLPSASVASSPPGITGG